MKHEVKAVMMLELTEEEFKTIQKFANFMDEYRGQICDRDEAVANVVTDFATTSVSQSVELLTFEDILLKVNV